MWAAVLGLMAVPAFAADPALQAGWKDDPAFSKQHLVLADVPSATGPAVDLFNGHDLHDWDAWLGYADPSVTYKPEPGTPLGPGGKGTMFTVVTEDGEPALRVDGATWGSLINHGDYGDYHLRLEYRFSGVRRAPRLDQPENNGLLYHSHGPQGAVWGTWARAVEFEIMTGSTGMVVPVGAGVSAETTEARDPSLIDPQRRFMVGGRATAAVGNTSFWNVENAGNAEKPVGQWNVLDLYVIGDHAIHVVNGVPVMEVWGLCDPDGGKVCQPLTHGHIQLQSEGAETFFRHITVEPIAALPKIEVEGK